MSSIIDNIYKNNIIILQGVKTMHLLEEKIALEQLWNKKFIENGSYTPEMVPITSQIKQVTQKLIEAKA